VSASEVSASSGGVQQRRPFIDRLDRGEWIGVDGARRQFASAPIDGGPWRVYVGVPSSVVFAEARGAFVRELAVGVVALVLLIVAVWILNRRVAGPLRRVTEAVVKASREPTRERVREAGTAELITLAREFNAMLDVRLGHEAQLAHQATHDPLTGLPNIILLRDRLQRALDEQGGNGTVAVLAIGMNRFKILNDSLGHDGADRVLVELGERLSAAVRPGDTLGRFSGDEFIVLCENVTDVDDAARRAEVVQQCLKQPFHLAQSEIVMSASIGVAVGKGAATTAGQLLREADSAMYQAKRGGHEYLVFDQALQTRATQHLKIEQALRKGLERQELLVHYQPLLDISSGRIVGAEALVRWQHPEWGLVPPLDFIPIAEQTGQISAIGSFVLAEACRQAATWRAAGHHLRMSVNVAVDQLQHADFPEVVNQALAESGLPSESLCLEITESSLMRTSGRQSSTLNRLRNLGVQLAIDDFGTGYSSLSYVHQLPVDELKIDRSFISRLDGHDRDRHLVEAIIGMATALGLTVVAEGVESAGQLEALAELGCQLGQGYLFAPPQPPDGFTSLLQAQRAKAAASAAC
jgi:diguanylate cyclase (GGDEF)-like protein